MNREVENTIKKIESIIAKGGNFHLIADEYTCGGCYVYAKIISIIIKEVEIYRSDGHCILYLDREFFDAENKPFSKAIATDLFFPFRQNGKDDLFCLESFGIEAEPEISIDEIIWCVEKYILKYGDEDNSINTRLNSFINMYKEFGFSRKLSGVRDMIKGLNIQEKSKKYLSEIEYILAKEYNNAFENIAWRFTNGGCYIYAKIISIVLGRAKIYINYKIGHCAVLLDDVLFDAEGIIPESERNDFRLFDRDFSDDDYCLLEYGFDCSSAQRIENAVKYYLRYFDRYTRNKKVRKRLNVFENFCDDFGIPYH